MDLLPVLFLVLIVLMCGGIAVLADDLGRRLGKKRLHFKGIRPKRVAQIGTFLAGITVSLVTIAIISVVSRPVRQWIKRGSTAIREVDELTKKQDAIQKDLIAAQNEQERLVSNNRSLDSQIQGKNREIRDANAKLTTLNKEISNLRPRLAKFGAEIKKANRQIRSLNEARTTTQNLLTSAKSRLVALQGNLKSVRTQLASTTRSMTQVSAENAEIQNANLRLLNEERQLERETSSLKEEIASLQRQQQELEQARDAAQAALGTARQNLSDTRELLAQAQNDLETTRRDLAQAQLDSSFYRAISQTPRYQPLMYRLGEEVARLPIDGRNSVESAKLSLSTLLRSARIAAHEKGARPNATYPEAGIFEHVDSRTKRTIPPDEIENEVAMRVASAGEPVVLVAYSTLNAFRGEPVSLEVAVYKNPVVYRRGQVVAETQIDGRRDTNTIYQQLASLGNQVREKAKRDKMIPKAGSDEWNDLVPPDEVYRLMARVQATERAVRVRATAESDIRAGDPLRLTFMIR